MLGNSSLNDLSAQMQKNGDGWREITVKTLRLGRSRDFRPESFEELRGLIHQRADFEERFFRDLKDEIR